MRLTLSDLAIPEEQSSKLPVELLQRWAAALEVDPTLVPAEQEALPLLWHWTCFGPTAPTGQLGHDGHPRLSAAESLDGLPRRMFASGGIIQHRPLLAGERVVRVARILRVEPKTGRSGRLLFVTVGFDYVQGGEVAIEEEQHLVYREPHTGPPPRVKDASTPPTGRQWIEEHSGNSVRLFRFSAATFNAHRIHYDASYAQQYEGYPALIVHGPLLAAQLITSASHHHQGATFVPPGVAQRAAFRFRALAPVFADTAYWLVGNQLSDREVELDVIRSDGEVAMTATLQVSE